MSVWYHPDDNSFLVLSEKANVIWGYSYETGIYNGYTQFHPVDMGWIYIGEFD